MPATLKTALLPVIDRWHQRIGRRHHAPALPSPVMHDTPPTLGFNSSYARLVVDHVRARDLDPQPVLSALGLPASDREPGPQWVPCARLAEALHRAAALCNDPHIGLSVGQQVRPANMGSLGYALISCSRLEDGLAQYERMQSLVCTEIQAEHRLKGEWLENRLTGMGDVPRDTHLWTFAMVSRLAFVRWVAGRRLAPSQTWLPCPPPLNPQPLLDYVGGPIDFDAPFGGERVPAIWLQLPNPHADAHLHQLMSALTDQQWAQHRQDQAQLHAVLRQLIAQALQQGAVPLLDKLGPEVEARLGLSARQIQRRLADDGQSFKELVEQVRREQVLHDLRHTPLPLQEVAQRAAYSELSALYRAVKRWTGLTPVAIRQAAAR